MKKPHQRGFFHLSCNGYGGSLERSRDHFSGQLGGSNGGVYGQTRNTGGRAHHGTGDGDHRATTEEQTRGQE